MMKTNNNDVYEKVGSVSLNMHPDFVENHVIVIVH